MSLKDIEFKLSYNSGDNDLLKEFFIPCLFESVNYDRAVGFFTSNVLISLSQGLPAFIGNSGVFRLVCSPKLTEEDIEAIAKGYQDRNEIISNSLIKEINLLPSNIKDNPLNCLSWLIASNKLNIKIAMPHKLSADNFGIYHEKVGVFKDKENNFVTFFGSNNETLGGLSYNYEAFDVFTSWNDKNRCELKHKHFEKLWKGEAAGVQIIDFPDAAKRKFIEKIAPQIYAPSNDKYDNRVLCDQFIRNLWDFQKDAINKWKENSYNGILSMATGTGKTKTAIGCIIQLLEKTPNLLVIIAGPQNTIIKQWETEIDDLHIFEKSQIIDGSIPNNKSLLADICFNYKNGIFKNAVIYTTYNTLSNDSFISIVSDLNKDVLLVCDEAHWVGAPTFSKGLLNNFRFRLGLSATPARYMDDEGSHVVQDYFRNVVFTFGLEKALTEKNPKTNETFLCPYNYYPIFVSLQENELAEYFEITEVINKQSAIESKKLVKSEYFQRLCEKRQRIITNAISKLTIIKDLLNNIKIEFLLIYCSPQQIDDVQEILNEKRIINHRFTGEEGTKPLPRFHNLSERSFILQNFEAGNYKALVAMKCLDEGINILRAETSILMASSGNPKEYIQRRGRLLRRHPQKRFANVYDLIVLPYLDAFKAKNASMTEKKILDKEMDRYKEFASLAQNKLDALNSIYNILKLYGLL
jgi:superfamily II DNA or RNA helicase